jgi:hypothetical protein
MLAPVGSNPYTFIGHVSLRILLHDESCSSWTARRSLLIAAAVQPDSIDMVLTRLLVCSIFTTLATGKEIFVERPLSYL